MYLSDRLLIFRLFSLCFRDGLLPGLINFEQVLLELGGKVNNLLFVFAFDNQERSFRPALQRLNNHVTVPSQLVILKLPGLFKVKIEVLVLHQLPLQVFIRLHLPLQHTLYLLIFLLDLTPPILPALVRVQ